MKKKETKVKNIKKKRKVPKQAGYSRGLLLTEKRNYLSDISAISQASISAF